MIFPGAIEGVAGEPGPETGLSRRLLAPLLWSTAAFLLRVIPSWSKVFTPDGVRFQLVDSWYHLRSIEFFALNFPHRLRHDPLAFFPGGGEAPWPPLFDCLFGALAWLTAGGSPSVRHVETVAAWAPAICGAGTVFVIYWVALRLFEAKTAQLAACLAAVLPGPFFVRSSLGFSDHHAFEVLLATILLATVLRALDSGKTWKGGLALGVYLLAWNGAALSVAILSLWAAFQITAYEDRDGRQRLTRMILSMFGLAALAALVFWSFLAQPSLALASLALGSCLVVAALLLGRAREGRGRTAGAMGYGLMACSAGAAGAMCYFAPGLWIESLGRLIPSGAELSVSEMRPLLLGHDGHVSLRPAWTVLGPMFFLFLAAWVAFAVETYRHTSAERTLLLAWSGSLLALTLLQFRFAASLGPFCALLVAWGAMRFLAAIDGVSSSSDGRPRGRLAVAWIAILLLAVYPSTLMALRQGGQDRGPRDAWLEGLHWLRQESPSLEDPAQYGVLAWWDYGSLITYRGRRAPMANGTGLGIRTVAEILTESDLQQAEKKILACGAKYLLIDEEMVLRMTSSSPRALTGKILGALQWAKRPRQDFVEIVDRVREDGSTVATPIYFPKYFQMLVSRLFLFGGVDFEPDIISLVRLEPRGSAERRLLRQLISFRQTSEARSFLEARREDGEDDWVVVSLDPFRSPIPIAAVSSLRSVYPPTPAIVYPPPLRIFEVLTSE